MKKIGILKEKEKLKVEIYPDKNFYKPGEKGKIKIRVKDYQNKPIKDADLSASIIDESIFSIKPEQSENIFDFLSQASVYKIYTSSMEISSNYFYVQTSEQKLLPKPVLFSFSKKGGAKITGKLINSFTNEPIKGIEIFLIRGDRELRVITDEKGRFIFTSVPLGDYLLLISSPDFENKVIRIGEIKDRTLKNLGLIKLLPVETLALPIDNQEFIKRRVNVLYKSQYDAVIPENEQDRSGGFKLQEFVEPIIRKDFKDAIYWNPDLITDERGEVVFEITFPDNLTSWRNSVKVIAGDLKAGENFVNVIVKKNLLIRVEVPRYINEQDEISLPVIVHNYSERDQLVQIQFDVKNAQILHNFDERMNQRIINPAIKEVIAKSNGVIKTNWRIKVNDNADTLIITAKAIVLRKDNQDVESDGIELKVPVEPQGIPIFAVKNFSLSKRKESFSIEFDLKNNSSKQRVIMKISPTLIGNIMNSLDELVGYPYGCVEQTMSRFLPSIIVANLLKELNIELKSKTFDELPEIVKAGLKRLKDLQHYDGGWGWWENDQTNPFMTAYVIYGLTLTKSAGYNVESDVFNRGLEILLKFSDDKKLDPRTRVYILFAISEAENFVDEKIINKDFLKEKFEELSLHKHDPYVLSYLIQIAIKNGFDDKVDELKKSLLKLARIEGNMVYWGDKSTYGRLINDRIEITANALKSLIISGVESSLIENAIRWLMYQKKGNFWISTKQTATVILSLVDYLKNSSELDADFSVDVKVNDNPIRSVKFTKSNIPLNEIIIDLTSHMIKGEKNKIEISKSGKGKLYCSLIEKSYVKDSVEENQLFSVERKYYRLTYVKERDKLERKLSEVKDTLKVGDRILVELKVKTNSDYEYFMLEDPLVPGFNYFSEGTEQNSFMGWFYHKELRDKKASFFTTNFNQGEVTFSYSTYAQLPGRFLIPPSVASLMYYPDLRGIGEEKIIVVIE